MRAMKEPIELKIVNQYLEVIIYFIKCSCTYIPSILFIHSFIYIYMNPTI